MKALLYLLFVSMFLIKSLTQKHFFSYEKGSSHINFLKGDTIWPLKKFDFNTGSWKAFYFIKTREYSASHGLIVDKGCFKTSDIELLKEMQSRWKFVVTGGDMATVENSFILVKNGKVVYNVGLVLEGSLQGLQSENFGWVEADSSNNLIPGLKKFKKVTCLKCLRF